MFDLSNSLDGTCVACADFLVPLEKFGRGGTEGSVL